LSLEELMATIEAIRSKDNNDKKFVAAINGVDLDNNDEDKNDVIDLKSARVASAEGFGINEGLGFMQMGEDEWQE
jgi:hypothetical protein